MKKLMLRLVVIVMTLQALFFVKPSFVRAEDMTCPPPTTVTIDIKPDGYPNKINLSASGLLPVAVLTTQDFDASQFTPEMAHLSDASIAMNCEGAAAIRWKLEDVNGDRQLDLVFFFKIQDLDLTSNSTAATLMAHGSYNSTPTHIVGTDSVVIKP
ncbi:MAG TPA: hypothetical protein VF918_18470 [Anaerolineales bacterium]